jgi:hypothetical protein
MLGVRICQWLLLFQIFELEAVVKPGKHNVWLDHLLGIELGEVGEILDDELPNT